MRESFPSTEFEEYALSTKLDVLLNDFNNYVKAKSSVNSAMAF